MTNVPEANHTPATHIRREHIAQLTFYLNLIAIGLIISIITLPYIKLGSFQFEWLDNTLGGVLMAYAFTRMYVGIRGSVLGFVAMIAWLGVLVSIDEHFIYERPMWWTVSLGVLSFLRPVAFLFFAATMHSLCKEADMRQASSNWYTVAALFVWLYLFPLFLDITFVRLWPDATWLHATLRSLVIVPLLFLLLTIYRTTTAANQATEQA